MICSRPAAWCQLVLVLLLALGLAQAEEPAIAVRSEDEVRQEQIGKLDALVQPKAEEPEEEQDLFYLKSIRNELRFSQLKRRGLLIMDKTHERTSKTLVRRVYSFDGLFGEKQSDMDEDPTYLRFKTSAEKEESQGLRFVPKLRLKAHLPNIKKRLKLMISTDDEQSLKREVAGNSTPFTGTDNGNNFVSTALRWSFAKKKQLDIHTDVGVKFSFPITPYAKTKYQQVFMMNEVWDFVLSETLFAYWDDEAGETTLLSFQRRLDYNKMLGFTTIGTWSNETFGLEWSEVVGINHKLTDLTILSYYAGIFGVTDPYFRHENWNCGINFRQQFLRSWLFYELTPEVIFRREDHWDLTNKFTLSIEAVIGNYNKFLDQERRPITR